MLRSIWILYLFGMFFIEVSFSDNQVVTYEVYSPKDSAPTHVDCQATESAFPCDDVKQQCIAREKVCDAVWDCEGGKDETVEVCGCLPHEFQCNASVCIDAVRRCDRLDDCEDGSDEDNCETYVCPVTHFKCHNHVCIRRDKTCDFVDDCGDNSDEEFCDRRSCDFGYFACDNGECTLTSRLCDGVENCKDGSDEDPKHCAARYQCPTGLYIDRKYECDGWPECRLTKMDEAQCGSCSTAQFQCQSGQCVALTDRCDGFCDCTHCDDELSGCDSNERIYCPAPSHFRCRNDRCLPRAAVCDGVNDCRDAWGGTDELFCHPFPDCSNFTAQHGPAVFRCPEGRCLPARLVCNHKRDCVGGEDEEGCTEHEHSTCLEDQFRCDNSKCVALSMRCDGTNDCYDWSDEMNCADDEDCPYGHRRCASGQCIPEYKWCNRWPNCPDRSDEQDCDYAPCQPDEFTCSNGECVPLSLVCHGGRSADGRGCEDKSHLVHCDDHVCGEGQFKCRKSYCVDESQVCDNNGDCLNLSDEETCEHPCPYGQNLCMCYDQMMSCEGKGYRQLPIPNPLEQINKLQLSGNRLALNSTTFSGAGKHMDSVVYLDLSNNSLNKLPKKMFRFMYKLKYLNLGNNSLTQLNVHSFTGLSNLTQLYLNGNVISHIDNGSFLQISRLTTLDLSYQNLTSLGPNTFLGLDSLHLLNLSGNRLEYIADGAFNGLGNLLTLDISNNRLQTIGKSVFYGMPQLSLLLTDEFRFCCLAHDVGQCYPEADEFSSCEDLMSNHVLRVAIWLLGLVATFGNALVIFWRSREVRGRKVHSILITNLALGDLLMGVYLLMIASVDSHYRGVYMLHDLSWRHSALCQFAGFLSTFSSELSVLTLTVITIDRLVCIIFPLRLTRLSVRDAAVAMTLVWLLVFFISALPLMDIGYFLNFYSRSGVCLALHVTPARPPGWEYSVAVFLVFNFLSFLIIAGSYIWMFVVAKETRSAVRSPETKSDTAMAKRMTLIVMTDFLCWVPIILLGFASLGGANASNSVYAWIAVFILPLNSAVNPVLYTLSTAQFMGHVQKRATRFRKSFMTSMTAQDTKNSFVDDRTMHSFTDRRSPYRQGDAIRMKALKTSMAGNSSIASNDL